MLTIWQAASLLTFGITGFLCLLNLIFAIRFTEQPFKREHALILAVCVVELIIIFLGIKA